MENKEVGTFLDIEDFLQNKNVFLNGISNKPCHSDSYMTVVDYNALDDVLQNNPFTLESWEKAIHEWLTNTNMQPPLKLVGLASKRFFKLV